MSSPSAPNAEPRRYGLKWSARAGLLFFAVVGISFAWSSYRLAQSRPTPAQPAELIGVIVPLLAALDFGISAFPWFVQLDSQGVTRGGFLRTRTLRFDAVQGRRKIWTRPGPDLVLHCNNPSDQACIAAHEGALPVGWYTVQCCR